MQYLFLDTNIFIHFLDFEQINWSFIVQTKDKVTITLAPMVIEELDKHKYNKNRRISKRARSLLRRIEELVKNPALGKNDFKYISTRPKDVTFTANNLNKTEQDDCVIAAILEFVPLISTSDKIIFITDDFGSRMKAQSLGINVGELGDDLLLPNEPDETEVQNKELQKEIDELKNRTPRISFTFLGGLKVLACKRKKTNYSKKEFIKTQLVDERNKHPYLIYTAPEKNFRETPLFDSLSNQMILLSEDQINAYNDELDEYYQKFEKYLESAFNYMDFYENSIKIEFVLENSGTAPAIDIDIEIHFPDGFNLLDEKECPKAKSEPKPPYKPKNRFDIRMPNVQLLSPSIFTPDFNQFNLNAPIIRKTNSYNVSYHYQSLKHNQSLILDPLFAKFDDISIAKGFRIDYELTISNVTKSINGSLDLKFED